MKSIEELILRTKMKVNLDGCCNLSLSAFFTSTVVNQYFEIQVYDVFVMRGNTAIFKCQIPSFVSDHHIELLEWTSTDNDTYRPGDDYGVHRDKLPSRSFPRLISHC